jgi:hypothetical protein
MFQESKNPKSCETVRVFRAHLCNLHSTRKIRIFILLSRMVQPCMKVSTGRPHSGSVQRSTTTAQSRVQDTKMCIDETLCHSQQGQCHAWCCGHNCTTRLPRNIPHLYTVRYIPFQSTTVLYRYAVYRNNFLRGLHYRLSCFFFFFRRYIPP